MANYRTRRIIPVALLIIVMIIALVGLVYIARLMFFSGGISIFPMNDNSRSSLVNTNADRAVRMTVRGNIVADEDFRSYQIQVSPSRRVLMLYKGYENQAIDDTTLDNNIPAYRQFVSALDRADMMTAQVPSGSANDINGVCATGFLYEFEILQNDKSQKKLWATSCSSPRGTLKHSPTLMINLFIKQIPGAQKQINGLWQ